MGAEAKRQMWVWIAGDIENTHTVSPSRIR
jgi:hypothetical protein